MENKTSTINIYIHSIWERMQRLIYKRESKEKSWELVKLEFKIQTNLDIIALFGKRKYIIWFSIRIFAYDYYIKLS